MPQPLVSDGSVRAVDGGKRLVRLRRLRQAAARASVGDVARQMRPVGEHLQRAVAR